MKLKIFKIVLIICVILFVFLGTVLAAEEENSVSGTQVSTVTSVTSLSDLEISELFDQFNPNKDGLLDYKQFVSELYSNKSIGSKKNIKVKNLPQFLFLK